MVKKFFLTLVAVVMLIGNCSSERMTKARQITFGPFAELGPIVSPDGHWIAFEYFADASGQMQFWIMPADGPFSSGRPIVNDGKYHAGISWSSDSRWVAYMTMEYSSPGSGLGTSQIDKTNIYTGETVRLTHFPEGTAVGDNTSWSKDGRIAFELNNEPHAIKDSFGDPYPLIKFDNNEKKPVLSPAASIVWSPDDSRIAFLAESNSEDHEKKDLWIADLASNEMITLLKQQRICCVSWPLPDRLLFSLATRNGSARVYLLSLVDHKLKELTSGPLDLAPVLHPKKPVLFFNHSQTLKIDVSDPLIMKLHVWQIPVFKIADDRKFPNSRH